MRDSNFLIENNARHLWHPMAHPAEMQARPPRIINAGEGVEVTDIEGRTVLDAVGGLWNVNLGYSCEPVKKAIRDQLDALPYYSTFRGTTNSPLIELSYELARFFEEDGLTRAFFTSGGSDSVETALRLARQFHKINGQPERTKFVSLKKGYHGTHFGGASVNGNANFRRNYEPLLPGVFHLAAPYSYRNPFNTADPAEIAEAIARQFEDEIAFQGADTIAAFIMEPVLGAGGVIVPHETFMPLMRAICDRHGILLIADEVVTGFGRTGCLLGSRGWGVAPDILCLAKGISAGYIPLGATLFNQRIVDGIENAPGFASFVMHGYTYSGHPLACAAALAVLDIVEAEDLPGNAARVGARLLAQLQPLSERHAVVGEVRGKGLMIALDLVSDRASRQPVDPAAGHAARIAEAARREGVLVRPVGSKIILSPPLTLTAHEAGHMAEVLDIALSRSA